MGKASLWDRFFGRAGGGASTPLARATLDRRGAVLVKSGNGSLDARVEKIRRAFSALFSGGLGGAPQPSPAWVTEVYDDHVVVTVEGGKDAGNFVSVPYQIDGDGSVHFDLDARRKVERDWRPVSKASFRLPGVSGQIQCQNGKLLFKAAGAAPIAVDERGRILLPE